MKDGMEWLSGVRVRRIEMREVAAGAVRLERGEAGRDWFEVVWVMAGRARYVRRGKAADIGPGWVVLRGAREPDAFSWKRRAGRGRCMVVEFEIEGSQGEERECGVARRIEEGDVLGAMLRWVWGNRELVGVEGHRSRGTATCGTEGVMDGVVGAMVGCLVTGRTAGMAEPPRAGLPKVVRKAMKWMRARLREGSGRGITNARIARAAGCSPSWLQFLFKRHLGMYPVQMLRRARLDHAVELLGTTDESVGRIAVTLGFVSGSHLSRHLKRELGVHARGLRGALRLGKGPPMRRLSELTGSLFEG